MEPIGIDGDIMIRGMTEIVERELDNLVKTELDDTKKDMVTILNAIKDERPDIYLKHIKYIKEDEADGN